MTAPRPIPQDHLKPAAQIEAEGLAMTDIEWRGHTFTVLTDPDDWSVDATLAFEEGKPASGVRTVLGKEQWAELMKSKPINRDLGDLFDTLAEALGLERVGE